MFFLRCQIRIPSRALSLCPGNAAIMRVPGFCYALKKCCTCVGLDFCKMEVCLSEEDESYAHLFGDYQKISYGSSFQAAVFYPVAVFIDVFAVDDQCAASAAVKAAGIGAPKI